MNWYRLVEAQKKLNTTYRTVRYYKDIFKNEVQLKGRQYYVNDIFIDEVKKRIDSKSKESYVESDKDLPFKIVLIRLTTLLMESGFSKGVINDLFIDGYYGKRLQRQRELFYEIMYKTNIILEEKEYDTFNTLTASKIIGVSDRTIRSWCLDLGINKVGKNFRISKKEMQMLKERCSKNTNNKIKTYIMKDAKTGLYKIGKSNNPEYREKTLQAEKPTIKTIKVFDYNIESKLHKDYNEQRVRGEWFKLNKIQLEYICKNY